MYYVVASYTQQSVLVNNMTKITRAKSKHSKLFNKDKKVRKKIRKNKKHIFEKRKKREKTLLHVVAPPSPRIKQQSLLITSSTNMSMREIN